MEGRQGIGGKMAQLLVSFRSQKDAKLHFKIGQLYMYSEIPCAGIRDTQLF